MDDVTMARPERRRHPRYEILAQVRFRHARTIHVLDVANISVSGLFVRVTKETMLRKVQVGERLLLDLATEGGAENMTVEARVVRIVGEGDVSSWGFGLEFTSVAASAREALDQLIQAAAGGSRTPPPLPVAREPFIVLEPVVAPDGEEQRER